MSTIYIAIGQCGNQVATSYFEYLLKNKKTQTGVVGLDDKLRCVFVDSEAKVIQRIERIPGFCNHIRKENIVTGRKGRGSNWSYGYHGSLTESHLTEDTLACIRKEIERCDCYSGCVILHSLAGGTGSGLGSRITETLRDDMGLHWILNCPVAPHDRGESPLQYYNMLLAMEKLTANSDGILLFNNDWLLNQLQSPQTSQGDSSTGIHPVSVNQGCLNQLIGGQLSHLLSPCSSLYLSKAGSHVNMEPWELIRSVCPFPGAHLMRCVSTSKSRKSPVTVDWSTLCGPLQSTTRRGYGTLQNTIACVCAVRGDKDSTFPGKVKDVRPKLEKIIRPVSWNPFPVDFWIDKNPHDNPSMTLAFNSGCITNYLDQVMKKARVKFDAKAYLHWYIRHGSEETDFEVAFNQVEAVIDNYNELTK